MDEVEDSILSLDAAGENRLVPTGLGNILRRVLLSKPEMAGGTQLALEAATDPGGVPDNADALPTLLFGCLFRHTERRSGSGPSEGSRGLKRSNEVLDVRIAKCTKNEVP